MLMYSVHYIHAVETDINGSGRSEKKTVGGMRPSRRKHVKCR